MRVSSNLRSFRWGLVNYACSPGPLYGTNLGHSPKHSTLLITKHTKSRIYRYSKLTKFTQIKINIYFKVIVHPSFFSQFTVYVVLQKKVLNSSSCHSKPVCLYFICKNPKKIFWKMGSWQKMKILLLFTTSCYFKIISCSFFCGI